MHSISNLTHVRNLSPVLLVDLLRDEVRAIVASRGDDEGIRNGTIEQARLLAHELLEVPDREDVAQEVQFALTGRTKAGSVGGHPRAQVPASVSSLELFPNLLDRADAPVLYILVEHVPDRLERGQVVVPELVERGGVEHVLRVAVLAPLSPPHGLTRSSLVLNEVLELREVPGLDPGAHRELRVADQARSVSAECLAQEVLTEVGDLRAIVVAARALIVT
jgi:hypothetical protein